MAADEAQDPSAGRDAAEGEAVQAAEEVAHHEAEAAAAATAHARDAPADAAQQAQQGPGVVALELAELRSSQAGPGHVEAFPAAAGGLPHAHTLPPHRPHMHSPSMPAAVSSSGAAAGPGSPDADQQLALHRAATASSSGVMERGGSFTASRPLLVIRAPGGWECLHVSEHGIGAHQVASVQPADGSPSHGSSAYLGVCLPKHRNQHCPTSCPPRPVSPAGGAAMESPGAGEASAAPSAKASAATKYGMLRALAGGLGGLGGSSSRVSASGDLGTTSMGPGRVLVQRQDADGSLSTTSMAARPLGRSSLGLGRSSMRIAGSVGVGGGAGGAGEERAPSLARGSRSLARTSQSAHFYGEVGPAAGEASMVFSPTGPPDLGSGRGGGGGGSAAAAGGGGGRERPALGRSSMGLGRSSISHQFFMSEVRGGAAGVGGAAGNAMCMPWSSAWFSMPRAWSRGGWGAHAPMACGCGGCGLRWWMERMRTPSSPYLTTPCASGPPPALTQAMQQQQAAAQDALPSPGSGMPAPRPLGTRSVSVFQPIRESASAGVAGEGEGGTPLANGNGNGPPMWVGCGLWDAAEYPHPSHRGICGWLGWMVHTHSCALPPPHPPPPRAAPQAVRHH